MNCASLQKIENRKISVITNFGCRAKCWYCIMKGHPLEHVNPQTDWKKLDEFLGKYESKGKVSLSGGGDCLYKFEDHIDWWKNFLDLVHKHNLLLDIHTREKFMEFGWLKKNINRVVFSSDHLDLVNENISKSVTDREYITWLSHHVKVRVAHLVTANTSFGMIEDYINFCKRLFLLERKMTHESQDCLRFFFKYLCDGWCGFCFCSTSNFHYGKRIY